MQPSRLYLIAMFGIAILMSIGCAYTKKEIVHSSCTLPDSVFYSKQVGPILQTNCYRCHSPGSNVSGILLNSYQAVSVYANNGYLYGTIAHVSGYRPMPDDGSKLDDCDIAIIKKWIDTGKQP